MKRLAWIILALSFATNVEAQSNYVTSASPAAASLMAEVFESVGYKAQEAVLNSLGMDIRRLGILLWVISAMTSLALFIFSKDTKTALWAFIGPSLFLFAIGLTTKGQRVEWRYKPTTTNTIYQTPGPFTVSWVFHEMNRAISKAYLSLITVITSDEQAKSVTEFMSREKLLSTLLAHRPTDSGLLSLTRDVILGCSRELEDARIVGAGLREPAFRARGEFIAAKARYDAQKLTPTLYTIQTDPGVRFVEELLTRPTVLTTEGWGGKCLTETSSALNRYGLGLGEPSSEKLQSFLASPQPCERLWCWMSVGFQSDVNEVIKKQEFDTETLDRLKRDLAEKMTQKEFIADARDPSGKSPLNGKVPIAVDPSLVPVVISGYLIRETMKELGLQGVAQAAFAESAGIELSPYQRDKNLSQEMSQYASQQSMQYLISQAKQSEIFVFASTIPHFQGLFLYTLGLVYPFFTLFLLSATRIKFFFTFFLFWAWVKSWDIGFALVTQIEAILWQFLPHSGFYDPQLDPDHGPASVLASAFDGDPAYGIGTYYTIIGALITAVPVLTAQIFVGSYASILTQLFRGLQNLAQGAGTGAQHATAVRQAGIFDSLRENSLISEVMSKTDISNPANWGSPVIGQAMNNVMKDLDQWHSKLSDELKTRGDNGTITGSELNSLLLGNNTTAESRSKAADFFASRGPMAVADVRLAVGRMRNNMKKTITHANANYNYFNAFSSSQGFEHYNAIRAAITGRREHWNFPSNPTMTEKDLQLTAMSQYAQLQTELAVLDTQQRQRTNK